MEVIEAIETRRSIRKFLDKKIDLDILAQILGAGNSAPSAGNLQSWKIIVVEDNAVKNKVGHAAFDQTWICTAPIIIIVCANKSKITRAYGIRGEMLYSPQECGMLMQNIQLAAHNFGIATCIVGAFDEKEISEILEIPEQIRPQAIIPLGYPDEIVPTPAKIPVRDLTYFERYGKRKPAFDPFPLAETLKKTKEKISHKNLAGKLKRIFRKEK